MRRQPQPKATSSMIPRFGYEGTIHWFPGHMAKASRILKSTVKVDLNVQLSIQPAYLFVVTIYLR